MASAPVCTPTGRLLPAWTLPRAAARAGRCSSSSARRSDTINPLTTSDLPAFLTLHAAVGAAVVVYGFHGIPTGAADHGGNHRDGVCGRGWRAIRRRKGRA